MTCSVCLTSESVNLCIRTDVGFGSYNKGVLLICESCRRRVMRDDRMPSHSHSLPRGWRRVDPFSWGGDIWGQSFIHDFQYTSYPNNGMVSSNWPDAQEIVPQVRSNHKVLLRRT